MTEPESTELEREGCLTAFLVVMYLANAFLALMYTFFGSVLTQNMASMPGWALPLLILVALSNILFAMGIWRWKRWGVYGFAVTSLLSFVVNIVGIGILPALFSLVSLGILFFLIRDAWPDMT